MVRSSYGDLFQWGNGLEPIVHADAAYYAPKDTKRKSVSGIAVMCGGAAIKRISSAEKCTTFSSSESEYVAIAESVKEVRFLRNVWHLFQPDFRDSRIQVLEDNKGAIQTVFNPVIISNMKTSMCLTTSCESISGMKSLTFRTSSRNTSHRFLDEISCQGRLPF